MKRTPVPAPTVPSPARWARRASLAMAVLFALGCAAEDKRPAATLGRCEDNPAHLEPGPGMSAKTREAIRTRMQRHNREMNELVWATLLLDYNTAHRAADALAAQTAPAAPGQPSLADADVPAGFLALEAEVRSRAGRMARAAAVHDDKAMSETYAALSQVCLDCHAVYRNTGAGNPRSISDVRP